MHQADAWAEKLVDSAKTKVVGWQHKLVRLSGEANNAKEKMLTG